MVVCPDMSSPAQSFASVLYIIHKNKSILSYIFISSTPLIVTYIKLASNSCCCCLPGFWPGWTGPICWTICCSPGFNIFGSPWIGGPGPGATYSFFRQHMKDSALHIRTRASPAKKVKMLESRKHHHFLSFKHSSSSGFTTEASSHISYLELRVPGRPPLSIRSIDNDKRNEEAFVVWGWVKAPCDKT